MDMTTRPAIATHRFRKAERLNGRTAVSRLFASGHSFVVYPYRIVYLLSESDTPPFSRVLMNVPKRNFKRAVKRNLIRRRIKEAYRLQKQPLLDDLARLSCQAEIAFLYIGKEVSEYSFLERKMSEALTRIRSLISVSGHVPGTVTGVLPDKGMQKNP